MWIKLFGNIHYIRFRKYVEDKKQVQESKLPVEPLLNCGFEK